HSILSPAMLHEVFLNPGIYLLFGGILIGFIGELQGKSVVAKDDPVFLTLFHGLLCLYLLEMGMTASKRMKDLRSAGWQFIAFGLISPNLFAIAGMLVAHTYSQLLGTEFTIGTYALFAVLCAAASYIAVPAIQRIAIPEASPTLPLAASLGLTFSYNVTIGITVYIEFAKWLHQVWPVAGGEAVETEAHQAVHAINGVFQLFC
ncbi:MAG TPA: sodium-dependent bicarbonate transport family permease, partial [Pirellulales bacterium]|nr:sodium-dependent bicarbonate transport family permease [Pirellulales bacterium]